MAVQRTAATPLLSVAAGNDGSMSADEEELRELYRNATDTEAEIDRTGVLFAIVAVASRLFNVYVGVTLFNHYHNIAGGIWFAAMGARVFLVCAVILFDDKRTLYRRLWGVLLECLLVAPVYNVWRILSLQRCLEHAANTNPSQDQLEQAEQIKEEIQSLQKQHGSPAMMVMSLFVQDIPLMYITKYQSISTALDPTQSLALRQFLQFQVSALLACVGMARNMFTAELGLSEPIALYRTEWLTFMSALGFVGKWRRWVTVAYRVTSTVVRTMSFSLFLYIMQRSEHYGPAFLQGVLLCSQYCLLTSLLSVFLFDGDEDRGILKKYRLLRPKSGFRCFLGSENLMLTLWNVVAPTEAIGAYFPLANSLYRFALLLSFELSNASGIILGYDYVRSLPNVHPLTVYLILILGMYWVLNLLLMCVWLVMNRHTVWPLSVCFAKDARYVEVLETLAPGYDPFAQRSQSRSEPLAEDKL